jgi:hypothetical protein
MRVWTGHVNSQSRRWLEWRPNYERDAAFSYAVAYRGHMSVTESRGPLAVPVVGEFPDTYVKCFQVSLIGESLGDKG